MLKLDLASVIVEAATVMALGTRAGVRPQASTFWLPAATTTVMPAATAWFTASVWIWDSPSELMLAVMTAGRKALVTTQSMAATVQDRRPEPESSKIFTAWTMAALATPKTLPPAMPATCVPWPRRSTAQASPSKVLHSKGLELTTSKVGTTRPPKSTCEARMPPSNT